MLPRKIFESLHSGIAMAVLVLFKHFSGIFCKNVLPLIASPSRNMIHFLCTFSIYECFRAKDLLLLKRFEIMEKLYSSTILLKMAGGGMHTPHSLLRSAPGCLLV